MKAFLIGLAVIILVTIFTGVGIILMPFFMILAFFLRILLAIILVIAAIWAIGKFVILLWESLRKR